MRKIIKVTMMPKRISPVNVKAIEYFVETDNYTVAHDKAIDQLFLDVDERLVHYYTKVAMSEIDIIK